MARRFKDPAMSKLYTQFRATPPLTRLTGLGSAYFAGFARPDAPNRRAPRDSLAYAAWAAGVDNARKAARQ